MKLENKDYDLDGWIPPGLLDQDPLRLNAYISGFQRGLVEGTGQVHTLSSDTTTKSGYGTDDDDDDHVDSSKKNLIHAPIYTSATHKFKHRHKSVYTFTQIL